MKILFKKFNFWISDIAATKWGSLMLFLFAFSDASFLPLPVTSIFLILIMLNTQKVVKQIFMVVSGTLLGALAGYFIGHFAWLKPDGEFTGTVQFLLNHVPGFSREAYEKVHHLFARWDFWILSAATATPLPYGMFSITSGVFGINILVFLITTLVSQGIKFVLLALFSLKLRPQFNRLAELNWKPVAVITSISVATLIFVLRSL